MLTWMKINLKINISNLSFKSIWNRKCDLVIGKFCPQPGLKTIKSENKWSRIGKTPGSINKKLPLNFQFALIRRWLRYPNYILRSITILMYDLLVGWLTQIKHPQERRIIYMNYCGKGSRKQVYCRKAWRTM